MSRRIIGAAAVVALVATMVATLGPGVPPVARAASCSGWSSHTAPPPTIRVFRHATGEVDVVRFRRYTKNVLSREWISSWTARSLRSGALMVRNYAWYQVLNWRGGVNARGECYDIRDDVRDQVYDPSKPIYRRTARAVDATWDWLVHRDGAIFPTYYDAGSPDHPCGANANGTKAYQWGTQACGLEGMTAAEIVLTYYYPDVSVTTPPPPPTASP
ncbi:MAG TPA: SpoIID/LytB domain-containing protein [Candidatus Limnocylindria bacterium]|nr:SpoIID/LytB domain-containing protein [Candidatus Limnocylindria bacterium]